MDSIEYSTKDKLSKQTDFFERAAAHGNMSNDERVESQEFDTVEAQAEMGGGWSNIAVDVLYLAADIAMTETDNNDKTKPKVVRERKHGQKKNKFKTTMMMAVCK